jgi:hypothetical protein
VRPEGLGKLKNHFILPPGKNQFAVQLNNNNVGILVSISGSFK